MSRFVLKNINYVIKNGLIHDVKNKTFNQEIVNAQDNFIIKIEYKTFDDIYVLYHTEVPVRHRGHDLGSLIAQEVFDYLIQNNTKTNLHCPFLLKFKKKYPNEKLNIVPVLPKAIK
ncbi:uncharacterized protein LOC112685388 [Sipha flava]|uniref:Protein NATD1 n=1 Tax=Sipha flava TaxID=143950 RepID=A0A8B8FRB4_9HEMI|nr:uncharacterized protein LOC112685388 [Sipha flava]